jgi:ribulose-5-phosphate 4-epimerase/fuculose-1-phosphate aldolase
VLANRVLASEELGIFDTSGHVSVRNPVNPSGYFVAPGVAPGAVKDTDVIARDLNSPTPDSHGLSIDDEIYKANPGVKAVLYARTPEIVAFSESVTLRPVVNGGAFVRDGLPVFRLASLDPSKPLLGNPALGKGVAAAIGNKPGVLLSGHGFVLTGRTIYALVDNAYQLHQNAKIERQAIALRGNVTYLNEAPVQPEPVNQQPAPAQVAPLGPPEGREWIYWIQNVSLN